MKTSVEAARQFLRTVLEQIRQYGEQPEQIYPLWAPQAERFDETLLQAIPIEASARFSDNHSVAMDEALLFLRFGRSIASFPYGNRTINVELAIAAYRVIFTVVSPNQFSVEWATTTSHLADAYSRRLRGERADNLERAIDLNHQALQVYTQDQFPIKWALTISNLAGAYRERLRGERADNLERAINLYHQALQVYTSEAFPLECYRVSSALGDLGFSQRNWQLAMEAYSRPWLPLNAVAVGQRTKRADRRFRQGQPRSTRRWWRPVSRLETLAKLKKASNAPALDAS